VEENFGSCPGNSPPDIPPDQQSGELQSTEHLTSDGHKTCSSHCCGTSLKRETNNKVTSIQKVTIYKKM
jgi:hypothetical protein